MRSSFRSLQIFAFLFMLSVGIAFSTPAHAESGTIPFSPVSAIYLVKDNNSTFGYKEKLRWSINTAEDWDRFYNIMPYFPYDKTLNPDPLKANVDDMIVLSRKDSNKLTGFDIYLSAVGIMVVEREADHIYYPDTNKLWGFLKEEQSQNASFENLGSGKAINSNTRGIVVTYNINRNIANPTWAVTAPERVAAYDAYFMALKPYTKFELQYSAPQMTYDDVGVFILNLNYDKAQAMIATVTPKTIRMSTSHIKTTYYQDPQDYYNFYKSQAREMLNYNSKYRNVKDIDERQF